jgi:hypothetical protein
VGFLSFVRAIKEHQRKKNSLLSLRTEQNSSSGVMSWSRWVVIIITLATAIIVSYRAGSGSVRSKSSFQLTVKQWTNKALDFAFGTPRHGAATPGAGGSSNRKRLTQRFAGGGEDEDEDDGVEETPPPRTPMSTPPPPLDGTASLKTMMRKKKSLLLRLDNVAGRRRKTTAGRVGRSSLKRQQHQLSANGRQRQQQMMITHLRLKPLPRYVAGASAIDFFCLPFPKK